MKFNFIVYPISLFKQIYLINSKYILFIILAVFITFNQIIVSKPILDRGIMPEDWDMLLGYKIEQQRRPFLLERISYIWETQDKLYKNQIIYIGIFNDIFGLNRTAYILTNIGLKILATLSIYLLLLALFKNQLLAFAASFFFSFSPSVAGSLAYIVTGDDYLSLIFMSLFGISYFNLITKGRGLLKASLFILLTILSSPLRMHPFLLVPIFIESFFVFKDFKRFGFHNNTLITLKISLKRLFLFIFPVYLLYLKSVSGDFKVWNTLVNILEQVNQGNWHTLLPPLFSAGFTITDNNALTALGNIFSQIILKETNTVLFERLIVILIFVTIITTSLITWVIKPKRPIVFFLAIYLPANILNFSIYLSIQNINNIPAAIRAPYNSTNFLAALAGGYYLILGIVIFLEWLLHHRKHKASLLLLPISTLWTYIFTSFTWLEIGSGISYGSPVHRYLTVPALGTSFFTAILIVMSINRIKHVRFVNYKYILVCLTGAAFILTYFYQINVISNYYYNDNTVGRSGTRQEMLKNRFDQALGKINQNDPALIYIELGKNQNINPDYENTFFNNIIYTAFYAPDGGVVFSCRTFIYPTYSELLKSVKLKDSEIQFIQDSRCTSRNGRYGKTLTYTPDNFYAFSLEDDNFSDIKDSVLNKLKADLK